MNVKKSENFLEKCFEAFVLVSLLLGVCLLKKERGRKEAQHCPSFHLLLHRFRQHFSLSRLLHPLPSSR